MAKFCGNCGTQLDDNAKICGNCGTPLTSAKTTNASIPGVGDDPEKKEKAKKKMTMFLGIAAVIIVVIIALSAIISSSGYKGTVRKIMNAYKDYDVDKIVSMSSGLYDSAGKLLSADNYFGDIATEADLIADLKANCIPKGIFDMDAADYEGFLAQRRILMARKIRDYYESL